jgi:hypothetical protein
MAKPYIQKYNQVKLTWDSTDSSRHKIRRCTSKPLFGKLNYVYDLQPYSSLRIICRPNPPSSKHNACHTAYRRHFCCSLDNSIDSLAWHRTLWRQWVAFKLVKSNTHCIIFSKCVGPTRNILAKIETIASYTVRWN